MAIPADIVAANAAGRVPDGVSLEYLAQSRDHSAIVGIIFMVCLTGILMVLRLYARAFLVKEIGLDDSLSILATAIYVAFVVLSVILIHMGSGRHIEYIQYVLSMPTVRDTEVLDFVAHILYTTALLVSRLSGLAFYNRLTARWSKLQKGIFAAAAFLLVSYLPQLFLLIFHCVPVTGLWPYAWQHEDTDYRCLSWGLVYSVNSGVSLVCDVVMFTIPSVLIKRLHVSTKRKISLSMVMLPGVFVIVISCVRIWLVAEGQWTSDGSWAYNPMMCIESAEIAGTLIALAVPGLKPLFGSLFSHLSGYTSGDTLSQSSKLHTRSKGAMGLGQNSRGSKRLLSQSKIDSYEMMPSETSLTTPAAQSSSAVSKTPAIEETNEVNIRGGPDSQQFNNT